MTPRRAILLSTLLLGACTGGDEPGPAEPAPAPAPASPEPAPADDWRLEPTAIRFDADDDTVFVKAELRGLDGAAERREEPVWVGVTVVTPEGEEIDLQVQTLFPGRFETPVMFSTDLEAEVQSVLIGAWHEKIEPCDVDRHGCREFGFVLDHPLASWPPGLYTEGVRQRIPPDDVALAVRGPDPERAETVQGTAVDGLSKHLSLFGAAAQAHADPLTTDERELETPTLWYRHPQDRWLAEQVADHLEGHLDLDLVVAPADDLAAPFLVDLTE